MAKKTNQTGFGEKLTGNTKRVINKDGSFNVLRLGAQHRSIYQYLIGISWGRFSLFVLGFYLSFNSFFALLYMWAGIENINGIEADNWWDQFFQAFFFSVQTFTTVGYGHVSPNGFYTNLISAVEAMIGLMGFALATGLLYGRFSKPRHSIRFSKNALVVDNEGKKQLHFQIANNKNHVLMEMEARVLAKTQDKNGDNHNRSFYELKLHISKILFFPLNWRIVHPIDESSPLHGMDEQGLKDQSFELLILIKGYDTTFNQTIYARHSYVHDEILIDAAFVRAYGTNEEGDTVMDLDMIDEFEMKS